MVIESAPIMRPERYRIMASALAGRPVDVVAGAPGAAAWTDGFTISVDPVCGAQRILEAVVIQAALIRAGSLSRELIRPLVYRKRLRQRYLSIEGPRAVADLGSLLPRSLQERVTRDVGAALSDSPAVSLALARTRAHITASGLHVGTLRPRDILAASANKEAPALVSESANLEKVNTSTAELPTAMITGSREMLSETEIVDLGQFFSCGHDATMIGRFLRKLMRGTGAAGAEGPIGKAFTVYTRTATPDNRAQRIQIRPDAMPRQGAQMASGRSFHYPEWDYRIGRYRREWCVVRIVEPDHASIGSLSTADFGLRRPLARLGTGVNTRRRQIEGDELDLDAVVENYTASETLEDDAPCYLARAQNRRDLATLILLDTSGSAAEPGNGRVSIHDHQRSTVAALATTMHRIGDRVAVYGFSSNGRHNVALTELKAFSDHTDHVMLGRLHHLQPSGYSRLGAAIRHGGTIIEQTGGTTRRLLIVVSDGLAFDYGYDLDYGARDARRALAEVRSRGTGCVCLTVGATGSADDLRLVFGTAAHASVQRPEQVAPAIFGLCRSALRSAEVRRERPPSGRI